MLIRERFIYIIIFLILCSHATVQADDAYPISYSFESGGSNLISIENKSSNVYSFNKNETEKPTFIKLSETPISNKEESIYIGDCSILGTSLLGDDLLVIISESNSIKALICYKNGKLSGKQFICQSNSYFSGQSQLLSSLNNASVYRIFNSIYKISKDKNALNINLISEDALDAKLNPNGDVIYIENSQIGANLKIFQNNSTKTIARLSAFDKSRIFLSGDTIFCISGSQISESSICQIAQINRGLIGEFWIDSKTDNIKIKQISNKLYILYLKYTNAQYAIEYFELKEPNFKKTLYGDEKFIEPFGLFSDDDNEFVIFRNGIVQFDIEKNRILALDFLPIGERIKSNITIQSLKDRLSIHSSDYSINLLKKEHTLWRLNNFSKQGGKMIPPLLLSILLIIFIQLYRHQRRYLLALQDQPSSGVVFVLNQNGKLLRANDSGKSLLSITESVPKKKHFQYYCINSNTSPLRDFVLQCLNSRDSISQKIMLADGMETKEWIFNVLPLRNIAGRFRGLVITGIDITEELEKKRLNNWAQLAHDMQTNLSTIRLNAEQLSFAVNSDNNGRREKIIHQVNILIQRVRDIVTVGRNNDIDRQSYDAADICRETLSEFDSALFPNVKFTLEAQSIKIFCDKPKIIRALRNAVENGIRSLPNKEGSIKLSNSADSKNVYFKIKDSGVGMDEKTKDKMLTPYFTTGAKEGGSGIGTMIMQHVVELHGGEIIINSEKGKGSEIIFSIPNYGSAGAKNKNLSKLFIRKKVT
jgi:signal transduction histidine kinase